MTKDSHLMFEKYINTRMQLLEKKQVKDEENLEVVKPSSEESEQEYLDRRHTAITAAVEERERSEEEEAINTHYNVNHEALDLVDALLNHPKKYRKADAIKILELASGKLQKKDQPTTAVTAGAPVSNTTPAAAPSPAAV